MVWSARRNRRGKLWVPSRRIWGEEFGGCANAPGRKTTKDFVHVSFDKILESSNILLGPCQPEPKSPNLGVKSESEVRTGTMKTWRGYWQRPRILSNVFYLQSIGLEVEGPRSKSSEVRGPGSKIESRKSKVKRRGSRRRRSEQSFGVSE